MKTLIFVIGWCLLFVLCWPLALLVLVLFPLVWLISLPLRLLGITLEAVFAFLRGSCSCRRECSVIAGIGTLEWFLNNAIDYS